ncbi:unnamed protein product, partial [Ixodes pacificus]
MMTPRHEICCAPHACSVQRHIPLSPLHHPEACRFSCKPSPRFELASPCKHNINQ